MATENIQKSSWKPDTSEEYKQIYVRRNMLEDERMKAREMLNKAKRKNDERPE